MCVCMYVCMYVHTYICMYVRTYIHTYVCMYVYVSMYVRIYVCVYCTMVWLVMETSVYIRKSCVDWKAVNLLLWPYHLVSSVWKPLVIWCHVLCLVHHLMHPTKRFWPSKWRRENFVQYHLTIQQNCKQLSASC